MCDLLLFIHQPWNLFHTLFYICFAQSHKSINPAATNFPNAWHITQCSFAIMEYLQIEIVTIYLLIVQQISHNKC